jgi:hypothetical protein
MTAIGMLVPAALSPIGRTNAIRVHAARITVSRVIGFRWSCAQVG